MKFKHLNVQNIQELVPTWAVDPIGFARALDDMLDRPECRVLMSKISVFKAMEFWVEVDARISPPTVRVVTPDAKTNLCGMLLIDGSSLSHESAQVVLPLNPMLRKYPPIAGTYSIYAHALQTDVPLAYIGMTKQRWFDRYNQHLSAAKSGSALLFHEGLRKHLDKSIVHRVFFTEFTHDQALENEEEFVAKMGLYPLGLNMIPGGMAGFKYLGQLGLAARNAEDRDAAVERLSAREHLDGRQNPLNAARWASDPQFVERVVCGHSGRLTVDEVRQIRKLGAAGKTNVEIQRATSKSKRQVVDVIAGRTYGRIA